MKVVVDTNIIFSAILNSNGLIGELLFNSESQFEFYSSEFIVDELIKYRLKLSALTKMSTEQVDMSIRQVLKNIDLISSEVIPEVHWVSAYRLTSGIDEKDTPFIATALSIGGIVWTGDKKLISGLKKKGFHNIFTTSELIEQRK